MTLLSALLIATFTASSMATAVLPFRVGTTTTTGSGSFSLAQVPNPNYVRHGPLALARAYHKFGIRLPKELETAVARMQGAKGKRSNGTAMATPTADDIEYV